MAIDMYSALHRWTEAKALAAGSSSKKPTQARETTALGLLAVPGGAPLERSRTPPAGPAGGINLAVPPPLGSEQKSPKVSGASQVARAGAGVVSAIQETVDVVDLMKKQAKINLDDRNYGPAADIYWEIGDFCKAIDIYGDRGMIEELYDRTRELPNKEVAALTKAGEYFSKYRKVEYAVEVMLKVGDHQGLAKLYVAEAMWDPAMQLLKNHPELGELIHVPYANWLALNDQFEKAQSILVNAGKPAAALQILEDLSESAIDTERFDDASYYCWQLAVANLKMLAHPIPEFTPEDAAHMELFERYRRLADIYFAYHFIHEYSLQPFTTIDGETLFNISRWLQMTVPESNPPRGLRRSYVLYTLARQSRALGAFKLARLAYEKLLQLRVPQSWLDKLEVGAVTIRSKPFVDKDDLQPICYRCSVTNPLVGKAGALCASCQHPFVFSSLSFEVLPLVEFELEDGIDDATAERLFGRGTGLPAEAASTSQGGDVQTMSMEVTPSAGDYDAFSTLLEKYEHGGVTEPVKLNKVALASLKRTEVFTMKWPTPFLKTRYYKSIVPETPVVLCPSCLHFFHEEDYEMAVIQKGHCPFCRAPAS